VPSSTALDLYAKVEDLLGVKEASPKLYAHYFLTLGSIEFDSLLDVGCGSGDFLYQVDKAFAPQLLRGIDLSPQMIEQSKNYNLDTRVQDLCSVEESFQVITAVFDMLNYLDKPSLQSFLVCIENSLTPQGYFLCDINTLFGFEEVAVGSLSIDDNERFLAIESDFDADIYSSDFTLFEKDGSCYKKSKESIKQYYHKVQEIIKLLPNMQLIAQDKVTLYLDEADKEFLVFRKI